MHKRKILQRATFGLHFKEFLASATNGGSFQRQSPNNAFVATWEATGLGMASWSFDFNP